MVKEYPGTWRQQLHWDAMEDKASALSVPIAVVLSPPNHRAIEQTLRHLFARHEAPRTELAMVPRRGLIQRITNETPTLELASTNADDIGATVAAATDEPFDLRGPLFRARLYPLSSGDALLIIVIHHSMCDGWSARILTRDLVELYRAYCDERTANLPAFEDQFTSYARWEAGVHRVETYWPEVLRRGHPRLRLPGQQGDDGPASFRGFAFPNLAESSPPLAALTRAHLTTPTRLLSAAITRSLLPHLGTARFFTLGLYHGNRNRPAWRDMVGDLADLLPIRIPISGWPAAAFTPESLVYRVNGAAASASANSVPLGSLAWLIRANPERMEGPILDVHANYLPYTHPWGASDTRITVVEPSLTERRYTVENWWSLYPLLDYQLRAQRDGSLTGQLVANVAVVPEATASQLAAAFTESLASFDPERDS